MRLWLDLETRCAVPIRRGTYAYAASAEIILWSWAVDDGMPQLIAGPTPDTDLLLAASMADEIWAHNAQFDRVIINYTSPDTGQVMPLHKWRCTAALARMHGLPGGLDKLCQILRLDHTEAKDHAGKSLIQTFCVPQRGATGYNDRTTHPDEWRAFCAYALKDVIAMREVHNLLPKWNATDWGWRKWHTNQKMNDRGVATDAALATAIVRYCGAAGERINAETKAIASLVGGDVRLESATQVARVRAYCEEAGVKLDNLAADTVERQLADENLPAAVRWLLIARQEVSKSSTAKAKRLLECVCGDGRMRGMSIFCGAARTGRSSGALFQPLNLPRPRHDQIDIDMAIECFLQGVPLMDAEHTMTYGSDALRGLLVASPGCKLLAADWVAIEGRGLCWLAGEQWELDAYALNDAGKGPKPYAVTAGRAFGVDPVSISKTSFEYIIGKVMTLALGYQGAVGALSAMAETYKLHIPEVALKAAPLIPSELRREAQIAFLSARSHYDLPRFEWEILWCLVQIWRRNHPRVCAFWYEVESAFRTAAVTGRTVQCGRIRFEKRANWTLMIMPSGRAICYPGVREEMGDGSLSFWGVNPYTRQWARVGTYGGKLVENACQALAVDLHDEALVNAEHAGLRPVLSVYDEIICDAATDRKLPELESIMLRNYAWAEGMPLAVEGWEGPRYKK